MTSHANPTHPVLFMDDAATKMKVSTMTIQQCHIPESQDSNKHHRHISSASEHGVCGVLLSPTPAHPKPTKTCVVV
jgi:hypothetical protein